MKTVYVNTDTFDVSMTEKDGFYPFQSNLFDYMSDTDIEAQFYIPMGYSYTDPNTGERWSGEFIRNKEGMLTLQNLVDIRNKAVNAANTADEAKEATDLNTTTLDDVMAALVELADLMAAMSEEPAADSNTTNEIEETTADANTTNIVNEEVIQNG